LNLLEERVRRPIGALGGPEDQERGWRGFRSSWARRGQRGEEGL